MSMTRVSRPGRRSPVASRDVLVVADGNEESYGAIGWARHVASASGAKVAVVDAAEGDDRESDTQVPRPHDRLSRRLDERGLGVDRVIVESGPVAVVVGRHAHDAGLVVIGSRPEAIKMAAVVAGLRARAPEVETRVCLTGQHTTLVRHRLLVSNTPNSAPL